MTSSLCRYRIVYSTLTQPNLDGHQASCPFHCDRSPTDHSPVGLTATPSHLSASSLTWDHLCTVLPWFGWCSHPTSHEPNHRLIVDRQSTDFPRPHSRFETASLDLVPGRFGLTFRAPGYVTVSPVSLSTLSIAHRSSRCDPLLTTRT